ncbi:LA_0364 family Cys-rich lipoprotein [Leptospira sp. 'Mane']|uniref:LA_0364 family Cys-rich lipoprotein n=1 Tax=Leptospira sp. 'Mane' TaxID=3387407 RepID=UPI00398AC083
MIQFFSVLIFFFGLIQLQCGAPFSPRSNCYEKNKCSTLEGACFLQNDLFYRAAANSGQYSNQDFSILVGTCIGLEKKCRKNCDSGTIF